ncbi:thioredoxin domain-containing protein, partial [Thermodesulfobacteriota bacterium]
MEPFFFRLTFILLTIYKKYRGADYPNAVSLFDIVLLLTSLFIIKALCPLCLATYICSWICLAGTILYLTAQRINPFFVFQALKIIFFPGRIRTSYKRAGFALLVLIIALGIGYGTNRYLEANFKEYEKKRDKELLEKALVLFSKEKPISINPEPGLAIGDADAPITIVEFSDFLCPFCARAARVVDELVQDNPHKIRVIFMNYPLDTVCNAYVNKTVHRGSCLFAVGAVCAAEQNRFEDYKR